MAKVPQIKISESFNCSLMPCSKRVMIIEFDLPCDSEISYKIERFAGLTALPYNFYQN